jgi:hypothetical protein
MEVLLCLSPSIVDPCAGSGIDEDEDIQEFQPLHHPDNCHGPLQCIGGGTLKLGQALSSTILVSGIKRASMMNFHPGCLLLLRSLYQPGHGAAGSRSVMEHLVNAPTMGTSIEVHSTP